MHVLKGRVSHVGRNNFRFIPKLEGTRHLPLAPLVSPCLIEMMLLMFVHFLCHGRFIVMASAIDSQHV